MECSACNDDDDHPNSASIGYLHMNDLQMNFSTSQGGCEYLLVLMVPIQSVEGDAFTVNLRETNIYFVS